MACEDPFKYQQRVSELRVPLEDQSVETGSITQNCKLERQAGFNAMGLARGQGFLDFGDGISGFRCEGAWRVRVSAAAEEVEEGREVFCCDSQ